MSPQMIEMTSFRRQVAELRGELDAAVARVLESGWFVLGEEVASFERELAAFVGAPHAIGVGNGMDAIQLALESCGVVPGDEVITTPFSAFASTLAIVRAGAVPVFVDIEDRTYGIDVERVADAVTRRTRAVLPVHLYGHPVDLSSLLELTHKRNLALVNDAAQAHGARQGGNDVGALGDATAYSFYPTKNLGCFGDGGAVTCADAERATHVRRGRDYGQDSGRRYHHTALGLNSRLDEMQAAILRVKLRHLARHNARRRVIATAYRAGLRDLPLALPVESAGCEPVWHQYVIRTLWRDALAAHLRGRQVQSLIHYPSIIPLQPALAKLGHRPGAFPVAERCAAEVLSLPIHPSLTDAEVKVVIAAVRSFFDPALR